MLGKKLIYLRFFFGVRIGSERTFFEVIESIILESEFVGNLEFFSAGVFFNCLFLLRLWKPRSLSGVMELLL